MAACLVQFLLMISCETIIEPISSKAKFLEATIALAQNLTQLALVIIGGTLVVIVGSSYYRPTSVRMRLIYLLFIPSWILLAFSISNGSTIQRRYLAYLFLNPSSINYQSIIREIIDRINNEVFWQIITLEVALAFLGLWLLIYLIWWIRSAEKDQSCIEQSFFC